MIKFLLPSEKRDPCSFTKEEQYSQQLSIPEVFYLHLFIITVPHISISPLPRNIIVVGYYIGLTQIIIDIYLENI